MTELLDRAVAAARRLSPEAQDDIARLVLRLAAAEDEPPVVLTPEEQAAIDASKAAAGQRRIRHRGGNTSGVGQTRL